MCPVQFVTHLPGLYRRVTASGDPVPERLTLGATRPVSRTSVMSKPLDFVQMLPLIQIALSLTVKVPNFIHRKSRVQPTRHSHLQIV